jgi:hypothetical protein
MASGGASVELVAIDTSVVDHPAEATPTSISARAGRSAARPG